MAAPLVLASASPRRRALLQSLGIGFEVDVADIPEIPLAGEAAEPFARRIARAKASAVAARHPAQLILAADTIVVLDGAILGKPRDAADARAMLRGLSERRHQVMTAVALLAPAQPVEEIFAVTEVEFRRLDDAEIDAYIATGEPFDKAGAYAIQGGAQQFAVAVNGSLSNVIGLPLEALAARLHAYIGSGSAS